MDDPLLVRCFKGLGDLPREGQDFGDRHRPARNECRQVLAIDELHHERTDTARFLQAVDVSDVGMVQRRQGLRLAREPCKPFCISSEDARQNLDRDVAIELRIARAVHLTHSACSERREDLVWPETSARGETHGDFTNAGQSSTTLMVLGIASSCLAMKRNRCPSGAGQ